MGRSWHDLYWHGENLATLCRSYKTQFQNAEADKNYERMVIWGECLRKATMNCSDIAKTVLGVEEIVKGKKIVA